MTEPTLESVLEELKKNLGEEAVEDILAEAELGNSLGIKIGGRKAMPGNAPPLNPERQAAVTRAGEIGMALTPLGRGIGAGIQAAKNFGSNVVKGFSGSSRNVTRSLDQSGKFAAPGAASKAGEAAGKAAANPTVQKGAAAAGVGALAAVAGGKDDKPEAKADTTSGPRKDMPGFKPTPEPSGDDLYKTPYDEKDMPSTKFPGPVRPPAKTPSPAAPRVPEILADKGDERTLTGKDPKTLVRPKEPVTPPLPPRRPQSDGLAGPSDDSPKLPGLAPDKPTGPRSAPKVTPAPMPQVKPQENPKIQPAPMPQVKPPENPKIQPAPMPTMRNDPGTPGKSAATPENQSNADYWTKEAERNRAQGGKPLPNEFNLFKEEKNFDQFVKKFIKEQK